jgi:hypothetical protein
MDRRAACLLMFFKVRDPNAFPNPATRRRRPRLFHLNPHVCKLSEILIKAAHRHIPSRGMCGD